MTYGDMQVAVRVLLNEQTQNKYQDTDVKFFLDYAVKLFSVETEILKTYLSVAWTAGDQTKSVISSLPRFLKMKHVIWNAGTSQARVLLPMDYIDLPWASVDSNPGTPTRYFVYDDRLGLYQTPNSSATVLGIYCFSAASLSANADVPQIPARWHMAPVHYATSQLAQKYGPPDKVSTSWSIWQAMISRANELDRRPTDPDDMISFRSLESAVNSDYPMTGTYNPMGFS